MPSTAAQDEFDALIKSQNEHPQSHPEDQIQIMPSPHSRSSSVNDEDNKRVRTKTIRSASSRASDDEKLDNDIRGKSGKSRTRYYIPSTRFEANTGPKGVIADAQAFEQARQAHYIGNRSSSKRQVFVPRFDQTASFNSHTYPFDQSRKGSLMIEADDDGSDDEFLSHWRQSRLNELAAASSRPSTLGRAGSTKARYGVLETVGPEGYLNAIDLARPDVPVIVFIFDEMSSVSNIVENCLENVARTYCSIRFIKMRHELAQMDSIGIPALIAYRNGEKFADMVPILNDISDEEDLSPESLVYAMKRKGML